MKSRTLICSDTMWKILNFVYTNIEITTGKYIQLYEIILGNYQISLPTILGEFTADIFTTII